MRTEDVEVGQAVVVMRVDPWRSLSPWAVGQPGRVVGRPSNEGDVFLVRLRDQVLQLSAYQIEKKEVRA